MTGLRGHRNLLRNRPHEGNELTREAYRLLQNAPVNFVGNVEGRDLYTGETAMPAGVWVCATQSMSCLAMWMAL